METVCQWVVLACLVGESGITDIFCTEFFLLLPGGCILDLKDKRMLGDLSIHYINPLSEYPAFIIEFHLLPQLCLVSLSAAVVEDELG